MTTSEYYDTIIITEDPHNDDPQGAICTQLSIIQYALTCSCSHFIVLDGNTLPCHDLQVFDDVSKKPYIDLCDGDDNSYLDVVNLLLPDIEKTYSGSLRTGHIVICTDIMKSLIATIEENQSVKGSDYIEKIINCCKTPTPASFNAYVLYGIYVLAKYPSAYKSRTWACFTKGSIFFKKETVKKEDLIWLSNDYDSITFDSTENFIQEYSDLFHSPYYREKLTPSQIVDAIYTEPKNSETDQSDNTFHTDDRLKYLNEDIYREYEDLGDVLTGKNIDQAYLCYENAAFLCPDNEASERIASKIQALSDRGEINVNRTAFVIISFNNLDFTKHCLESIYSNCNPESFLLMVFDNGSSDGSQEWLSEWGKQHEEAIVILNDSNLGFAGGNNACCRYLPEGYDIFYLNNDTRIPPNALFWMRMALYSSDDIGGVGAVQNYAKGDQLEDVYFDLPEQYVEYGAKHNIFEPNPYEEQSKICGFAMLITREMYNKTGGFDEQFNPGFLEDDDMSLQIRAAGKKLILCQNAFIYHAGSQSFRKRNDINELFRVNREKCIKKWGFDPTLYAAMSENEYAFILSLEKKGYKKDSIFSLVHIDCGCGNMLGHIHYLYPNATLAGVEKNETARKFAISCISVVSSVDDLPMELSEYEIVVNDLG